MQGDQSNKQTMYDKTKEKNNNNITIITMKF